MVVSEALRIFLPLPDFSDVKSWSWSNFSVLVLVLSLETCGLGLVSCGLGLGLELCGLVNNVARPTDS